MKVLQFIKGQYETVLGKYLGIRFRIMLDFFNPLSTIGLLTPVLIGSYLEIFTCVANFDKALKMLHAQTST